MRGRTALYLIIYSHNYLNTLVSQDDVDMTLCDSADHANKSNKIDSHTSLKNYRKFNESCPELDQELTCHMITSSILIDEPSATRASLCNPFDLSLHKSSGGEHITEN